MKTTPHITLFLLFNFALVQFLFPQKIDHSQIYEKIESTITNINLILGRDCKMEFDQELIVTFYQKGILFRQDRVYLDALDPNKVCYIPEEKSVSVQCMEFKGLKGNLSKRYGKGCIGRELVKVQSKSTCTRITLPVMEADTGELKTELENLIRLGHVLIFK